MAQVASLSMNTNVPPGAISIPKRGVCKVICPQTITPQGAAASFGADALAAHLQVLLSGALFSLICCCPLRATAQGPRSNQEVLCPQLADFSFFLNLNTSLHLTGGFSSPRSAEGMLAFLLSSPSERDGLPVSAENQFSYSELSQPDAFSSAKEEI